ncbi:hypothetical protein SCHPADRAFT_921424 [Schizopora paradoxa]|uniref:GST N-terminal domain-containing protein n=1 Tax=Schizopora paradoxa TaxID=27342 RepID=A0A0H2RJY1_9AGAM|nr:hypothetical protein SCHPADRAFT_921424 [Schizopora paradoxa]
MITLYDIPSLSPTKAWSPNTFKTRAALLFKGLQFKTEWIEYPDIAPRLQEMGVEATEKQEDGTPLYTLPVIKDDSTGQIVADSWKIAIYLDETYPDKPTLFPFGVRAPIHFFQAYFFNTAILPGRRIFVSSSFFKLNPASEGFFRRTREAEFGVKMEELAPPGPKRDEEWNAVKEGFSRVAAKYESNEKGSLPYFYGDKISYADLIVVAYLLYVRTVLGPESPEWKEVGTWDDGRWMELLELTKRCQVVDA